MKTSIIIFLALICPFFSYALYFEIEPTLYIKVDYRPNILAYLDFLDGMTDFFGFIENGENVTTINYKTFGRRKYKNLNEIYSQKKIQELLLSKKIDNKLRSIFKFNEIIIPDELFCNTTLSYQLSEKKNIENVNGIIKNLQIDTKIDYTKDHIMINDIAGRPSEKIQPQYNSNSFYPDSIIFFKQNLNMQFKKNILVNNITLNNKLTCRRIQYYDLDESLIPGVIINYQYNDINQLVQLKIKNERKNEIEIVDIKYENKLISTLKSSLIVPNSYQTHLILYTIKSYTYINQKLHSIQVQSFDDIIIDNLEVNTYSNEKLENKKLKLWSQKIILMEYNAIGNIQNIYHFTTDSSDDLNLIRIEKFGGENY